MIDRIQFSELEDVNDKTFIDLENLWWAGIVHNNELIGGKYKLNHNNDARHRLFRQVLDSPNSVLFVARLDSKIIGFIVGEKNSHFGGPLVTNDSVAMLIFLTVDHNYRRKGIGTHLFFLFEEWARKNGMNAISLHAFLKNTAAVGMFKKIGYEMLSCEFYKCIRILR